MACVYGFGKRQAEFSVGCYHSPGVRRRAPAMTAAIAAAVVTIALSFGGFFATPLVCITFCTARCRLLGSCLFFLTAIPTCVWTAWHKSQGEQN